jgi:hypothetical protein
VRSIGTGVEKCTTQAVAARMGKDQEATHGRDWRCSLSRDLWRRNSISPASNALRTALYSGDAHGNGGLPSVASSVAGVSCSTLRSLIGQMAELPKMPANDDRGRGKRCIEVIEEVGGPAAVAHSWEGHVGRTIHC